MLIQWLIDFFRDVIVNWIRGVPHPPEVLWTLRDWLVSGGVQLNTLVSKFGVVVPWEAFAAMVGIWVGLLAFWATMLVVRVVMWAVGR